MTCANCIHNCKKLDICWMFGIPPDLKGTHEFAEQCQYFEENDESVE